MAGGERHREPARDRTSFKWRGRRVELALAGSFHVRERPGRRHHGRGARGARGRHRDRPAPGPDRCPGASRWSPRRPRSRSWSTTPIPPTGSRSSLDSARRAGPAAPGPVRVRMRRGPRPRQAPRHGRRCRRVAPTSRWSPRTTRGTRTPTPSSPTSCRACRRGSEVMVSPTERRRHRARDRAGRARRRRGGGGQGPRARDRDRGRRGCRSTTGWWRPPPRPARVRPGGTGLEGDRDQPHDLGRHRAVGGRPGDAAAHPVVDAQADRAADPRGRPLHAPGQGGHAHHGGRGPGRRRGRRVPDWPTPAPTWRSAGPALLVIGVTVCRRRRGVPRRLDQGPPPPKPGAQQAGQVRGPGGHRRRASPCWPSTGRGRTPICRSPGGIPSGSTWARWAGSCGRW